MKKLVISGLKGSVRSCFTFLVMLTLLVNNNLVAQPGCILTCPPMDPPVEISLSPNCEDVVIYEVRRLTGKNEFVVRKSEQRTSGILMYEIESNFQYRTNRMIIVE